jgi:hypothetical protein
MLHMMTLNETIALCKTFKRKVGGKTYYAYAAEHATPGVCIDFEGNPYWGTTKSVEVVYCKVWGEPTIPPHVGAVVFSIEATNAERIKAHWESFLVNHNAFAPRTMARVHVNNGPGRCYSGKVVRTTKTRVEVSYKFKNGKRAANKWFKLNEVSW